MYRGFFKRAIDFFVSLAGLLALLPVLLILTVVLWFKNNGKPFFFQKRPGKNEREFSIIKFKTMTDERDKTGALLPDAVRLTPFGKFVRNTSLDELPQLINVLKGDMSLIGPRPLLHKYIPLYSPDQRRRHLVRPGITGWAQVNGRNSISWTDKFKHDVFYVDNMSFMMDVKILWMTFKKVIKREGVNQSDERPMQPFTGNN